MGAILKSELSFLRAYAVLATLLGGVILLSAFGTTKRPAFEEIDVQRINIVERDGKLRMVISNQERFPEPVMNGKVLARQGGKSPGIVFYNEDGDESGGLIFGSETKEGKFQAGAALLFDQYKQDQTVGIMYNDVNRHRSAGLKVWDRPNTSLADIAEKFQSAESMKEGPEKTEALKRLGEAEERGEFGASRVFVGKNPDGSAVVVLSDPTGRPRISATVDAAGNSKLAFLDEHGKVLYSLPPSGQQ